MSTTQRRPAAPQPPDKAAPNGIPPDGTPSHRTPPSPPTPGPAASTAGTAPSEAPAAKDAAPADREALPGGRDLAPAGPQAPPGRPDVSPGAAWVLTVAAVGAVLALAVAIVAIVVAGGSATDGDTALQTGGATGTQTVEVELGEFYVEPASTQALCTVPGHKEAGMVLDITVTGAAAGRSDQAEDAEGADAAVIDFDAEPPRAGGPTTRRCSPRPAAPSTR